MYNALQHKLLLVFNLCLQDGMLLVGQSTCIFLKHLISERSDSEAVGCKKPWFGCLLQCPDRKRSRPIPITTHMMNICSKLHSNPFTMVRDIVSQKSDGQTTGQTTWKHDVSTTYCRRRNKNQAALKRLVRTCSMAWCHDTGSSHTETFRRYVISSPTWRLPV